MVEKEKAILVGVNINDKDFDNSMIELKELAKACDIDVADSIIQNLSEINRTFYVGTGKIDEIKEVVYDKKADLVIFNDELLPSQLKNLQSRLNIPIFDRTSLILEIFARRAKTKEAKIQVEIAKLKYMLPRLVGLHSSLGRQGGGSGLSNKGSGEKKLELDRRKIEEEINYLSRELKQIELERSIRRRKREDSKIPLVALAGYTNAGKSTLMNAFIEKNGIDDTKKVEEKDMLFATLDTSVRKITLEDNKQFLLSDTVGFISKLPHNLIRAFRSTLEEIINSDLILQVVDYSDPNYKNHIEVTNNTLSQIGADNIPIVYVYNKCDLVDIKIPKLEGNSVYISASKKIGMDELIKLIKENVLNDYVTTKLFIPFSEGEVITYLKNNSTIYDISYTEQGTVIYVECRLTDYNKFKKYEQK